jgi:hypothetical protein
MANAGASFVPVAYGIAGFSRDTDGPSRREGSSGEILRDLPP